MDLKIGDKIVISNPDLAYEKEFNINRLSKGAVAEVVESDNNCIGVYDEYGSMWYYNHEEVSKYQPTNAERIRSMSDEELAKMAAIPFMFMSGYTPAIIYRGGFSGIDYDTREEAEDGELEWLRSAAISE